MVFEEKLLRFPWPDSVIGLHHSEPSLDINFFFFYFLTTPGELSITNVIDLLRPTENGGAHNRGTRLHIRRNPLDPRNRNIIQSSVTLLQYYFYFAICLFRLILLPSAVDADLNTIIMSTRNNNTFWHTPNTTYILPLRWPRSKSTETFCAIVRYYHDKTTPSRCIEGTSIYLYIHFFFFCHQKIDCSDRETRHDRCKWVGGRGKWKNRNASHRQWPNF